MKTKEELSRELDAFLAYSEKALKTAKKLISSTEAVLQRVREMNEEHEAAEVAVEAPEPEKAEAAESEQETAAPEEKAYSFEEVRGIMAGLAGSGKRAEAKALLTKYGAAKLSDVKPEDYPALVRKAEVIANG